MILAFDQLHEYRQRVAMVDGAFDPLHRGHIEYFRAASQLGVPLLCNVASDRYVGTKHRPLLPEDSRAAIVDAMRFISYTHIYQIDTETVLRELRRALPREATLYLGDEARMPYGPRGADEVLAFTRDALFAGLLAIPAKTVPGANSRHRPITPTGHRLRLSPWTKIEKMTMT